MAGRIELFVGPMFAGKTNLLLSRTSYKVLGNKIPTLIKPYVDSRDGDFIKSHDGKCWPACRVPRNANAFRHWIFQNYEDIDDFSGIVLVIDEIQFFDYRVAEVLKELRDKYDWTIYAAGLDMDYRRRRWPVINQLYGIADEIVRLRATCAKCGDPADFTQRLHPDGTPASRHEPRIMIDNGSVRYEPRCWRCHIVAG